MAVVRIPSEDRIITGVGPINAFLQEYGIHHENWKVSGRLAGEATADEVLAAFAEEIDHLKVLGNYVTADVIQVTPDTPGLQAMLDRFNQEHTHAEDEVRFIVEGSGVFHIHGDDGTVFSIEVLAGDLINVPRGTKHWFDLCEERRIRAIRLFQDESGWTPLYTGDAVAGEYLPVCFGPAFVRADLREFQQAVLGE